MSKKTNIPPHLDPDATISVPLTRAEPDGLARLKNSPIGDADPEITISPVSRPVDPDATFSGPLTEFDPDATISNPGGGRRRSNPFAPKALPEALQANLAGLGGLNTLVAFANPILSAVPQIAAARNHPDPARLRETLQDLIEAFEAGASKAGVGDETLEGAVYALCCLVDDCAASTPWGKDWTTKGLLHELRGETDGGEEFFELLQATTQKPEDKGNLLEFLYICLALGFQGRYRKIDHAENGGNPELDRIRGDLHKLITRRRARPASGLSERWRAATAGEMPQAHGADLSRRAGKNFAWKATGAAALTVLVLFAGYKALDKTTPDAVAPTPAFSAPAVSTPSASTPSVSTPSASTPSASVALPTRVIPPETGSSTADAIERELAADIRQGLIAVSDLGGRSTIIIRDDRQFTSGTIEPTPAVQAVIGRIADALGRTTGPILVRGYADSIPVKPGHFASNQELSAARAKAVATLIGTKMGGAQRVTSEGAGEADPIAPNDTQANRAKNRRVAIILGPQK